MSGSSTKSSRKSLQRSGERLASRMHVAQLVDAMGGDHGGALVGAGVDADDVSVAEIVVVADDCFQHFQVLVEHPRGMVKGVDLCDGCYQAALACGAVRGAPFQCSSSSSRLIM